MGLLAELTNEEISRNIPGKHTNAGAYKTVLLNKPYDLLGGGQRIYLLWSLQNRMNRKGLPIDGLKYLSLFTFNLKL